VRKNTRAFFKKARYGRKTTASPQVFHMGKPIPISSKDALPFFQDKRIEIFIILFWAHFWRTERQKPGFPGLRCRSGRAYRRDRYASLQSFAHSPALGLFFPAMIAYSQAACDSVRLSCHFLQFP
jgi:hypothetical protein